MGLAASAGMSAVAYSAGYAATDLLCFHPRAISAPRDRESIKIESTVPSWTAWIFDPLERQPFVEAVQIFHVT